MKRILYVECNEDGTVGGSHKILADLVLRLSAEFQPVVLFYQDNPWRERLASRGVEVHTWDDVRKEELAGYRRGGKGAVLATLVRGIEMRRSFLERHRIDLVHMNNSPLVGHDDWLPAAGLRRIPCMSYSMGDAHVSPGPVRRVLMRQFDRIFPLSRYLEESLRGIGVPAEKLRLAYPGLDIDEIAARKERPVDAVRAEFGVGPDQVLALMVGNLREWKGQHVVLDAVTRLDAFLRARLVLLFVGEAGPEHAAYEEAMRRRVTEGGLAGCARFIGRRTDVPDLFEAAEIAIHASIIPEPFGLVVLEALCHGCAVVASRGGGPAEMLTPSCGRMFDPGRPEELAGHLRELLVDDVGRREMGAEARARSRAFDVRRHVAVIERSYRELLA